MLKILIADDDARMRQLLKQMVAGHASAVYEAADGADAFVAFAAERPDLVLMDLRMRPVDGLRATAQIKACFPDARIAIVSQFDEPELRSEAARAGACAYIVKDQLEELTRILCSLNQNQQSS